MMRLPPTHTLQAFESASRLLNFSRAAEELNVTPAAVSHQIKILEERLGVRLFKRANNKIRLTLRGKAYLPPVCEALQLLAGAGLQVRDRSDARVVNLSVLPIFAIRWLIPRMRNFQELHPDLDLRISTTYRLVDFAREDIDAAVRFGDGNWPGLIRDFLFQEEVVPVCSPKLLSKSRRPRGPEDLKGFTLLHSANTPDYWRLWLAAVGVEGVVCRKEITIEDCLLCFEAACEGIGIALINRKYAERAVSDGRLMVLFDIELPRDRGWYFVCPEAREDVRKIADFRTWLIQEMRR